MANTISDGSSVVLPPQQFSMDFQDMQDNVYFLIDESESSLFPRTIIKRYVNQGLYEVARQTGVPLVRQTFTTPLTNGECELLYPIINRDTAIVNNVRYDGTLLEHIDENDITNKTTTGDPSYYYIDGGSVMLYPVPTTSANTVIIEYVKEPVPLDADTDVSEMSATAQELACVWAAMKAKGKDDEYNSRDRLASEFEEGIARLRGPLTGFYE